jgi:hypothetical protein
VTAVLCGLGGLLFLLEPFGFGLAGIPLVAWPLIARYRNPPLPQSTSVNGVRPAA